MAERQTNRKIKCLRSDNGGEYMSNEFNNYLERCGIQRQLTVPYTPQQNGVAERANRTIVEMARCMLVDSKLNQNLWAEAVATVVYLRNRSPSKSLDGKTPYEVWTGRKPSVSHLKIFGSKAVVLNKNNHKFEPKGSRMVMVGYSLVSKAYRLYDKKNREVIERRNVLFDEHNLSGGDTNDKIDDFINFEELFNTETSNEVVQQSHVVDQDESSDNESYVEARGAVSSSSSDEFSPSHGTVKRGPGRPKILRNGKPGRPRKIPQLLNNAVEEPVPNTFKESKSCKMGRSYD